MHVNNSIYVDTKNAYDFILLFFFLLMNDFRWLFNMQNVF